MVWLHGLGDPSPTGWRGKFHQLLPHLGDASCFHQPIAPTAPVTAHKGELVPSWFDVSTWPISTAEPGAPTGLEESIARVHVLIEKIQAEQGLPAHCILLGGFSQGGALALMAGLSYSQRLAGVVSLSGWCPCCGENDLSGRVDASNRDLPVLFSSGKADPIIEAELSQTSAAILSRVLSEGCVTVKERERSKHLPSATELQDAARYMIGLTEGFLPPVQPARPMTPSAATERKPLEGGWLCSGETNDAMVLQLETAGIISAGAVSAAMRATDRGNYVPELPAAKRKSKTYAYGAYCDAPQALGYKATISAPHMHAKALDLLAERLATPGCRVLDVGSGSGVMVALFSRMIAANGGGVVVGIEVVPELVEMSVENLRKDGLNPNAPDGEGGDPASPRMIVRCGNGWEGAAELGPYDAIHVGAAPPEIPDVLKVQLKVGGRMIIPLGEPRTQQRWTMVDRVEAGRAEEFRSSLISTVRFVPLVEEY